VILHDIGSMVVGAMKIFVLLAGYLSNWVRQILPISYWVCQIIVLECLNMYDNHLVQDVFFG